MTDNLDDILKKLDAKAIALLDQAIPDTIPGAEGQPVTPPIAESVKAFEAVTKWFSQRLPPAPDEGKERKGSEFGRLRARLSDRTVGSRPGRRKAPAAPAGGDPAQPPTASEPTPGPADGD